MTIRISKLCLFASVLTLSACIVAPDYGPGPGPSYNYGYGAYAYPWEFGERVDIVNGYGHGGWHRGGWGSGHAGGAWHGGGRR